MCRCVASVLHYNPLLGVDGWTFPPFLASVQSEVAPNFPSATALFPTFLLKNKSNGAQSYSSNVTLFLCCDAKAIASDQIFLGEIRCDPRDFCQG